MFIGNVQPLTQSAVRQVQQSAKLPLPRTESGAVDWHALSAMTGAFLAAVTIWQIVRIEKRRR